MVIEATKPQNEAWYRSELVKDIVDEQERWVSEVNKNILWAQKAYFKALETGQEPKKSCEFCYAKIENENIRDYVYKMFSEAGWKVVEDGTYLRFAIHESINRNLLAPRDRLVDVFVNGKPKRLPLQISFDRMVAEAELKARQIDAISITWRYSRSPLSELDSRMTFHWHNTDEILTLSEGMEFEVGINRTIRDYGKHN